MSINIQENIPLAQYTTFRIGGLAKFFCEVENEEELMEGLKYALDNKLEFFVLGGGSNILVSDKGFNGIVIKLQGKKYEIQDTKIECSAGVLLSKIVSESAKRDLTGLEWAAGIPGTIGGAIRGNAGAFGKYIGDVIERIKVIVIPLRSAQDDIKVLELQNNECKFSYRNSIFKQNQNLVILSCVLNLKKGNKDEILVKIRENIKNRSEKQPREFSAGSFFQNPVVKTQKLIEEFEREKGIKCKDVKLPAGWLIDQVELRGKKIGGAMVSEKHANFIVNIGGASAENVIMLASLIKQQVRDKFGIELQEEVQYLGF